MSQKECYKENSINNEKFDLGNQFWEKFRISYFTYQNEKRDGLHSLDF